MEAKKESPVLQVLVAPADLRKLDALVERGVFRSRSDAVRRAIWRLLDDYRGEHRW
ncbi:MAG: ribbon-helix-helix domain-containing protein [Methermicoccaceae archaeon]